MTEAEWLAATDPTLMLEFLGAKASDRKIRLFTVACAKTVWNALTVEDMRRAVETGERLADGLASEEDRYQSMSCLYAMPLNATKGVEELARFFTSPSRERFAAYLAALVTVRPNRCTGLTRGVSWDGASLATGRKQPGLLRDIFGPLPFRPIALDPSWLTSTVVTLAEGIYADRAFDRMPILADALHDAACNNEDILRHCREPGEHVRGCWVVDLLTGRR